MLALHNQHMLQAHPFTAPRLEAQFSAKDLHGLSPAALTKVATQMLAHIAAQSQQITTRDQVIAERDRAIKFKDAKIERITFELARLKAWKFAARTEAMNAEQRQLFEETVAADEASLQAQLDALQDQAHVPSAPAEPKRQPKRQALPEHLVRVDHHHEPESTLCPTVGCALQMVRVGEDISERLDIIPAQFFVHRHIRGLSGGGAPAPEVGVQVLPDLGARTRRATDHRQRHSHIGLGRPHPGQPLCGSLAVLPARGHQRSQWGAHTEVNPGCLVRARCGGAALQPLLDVQREFVLGSQVLHADETPVDMLDPGAGKTKKAYVWAYARGGFDAQPWCARLPKRLTSASAEVRNIRRRFCTTGRARWCAMSSRATAQCSSSKAGRRLGVWRMREGSSTN